MHDASGRIIYVGKAGSLKKRLASYLGRDLDAKTSALMQNVVDVEFRLCANEAMALLLEAGLIHELKPRYNVSLRDDKSFPLIKISNEEFPLICVTRKKDDPHSRYLGPYTSAKLLRSALKIIRRSFGYRSCRIMPKKGCIYCRINLCPGPCISKVSPKDYSRIIDNIVMVLEGKGDLLIRQLSKTMQERAKAKDFEAAAALRDQIAVLSEMSSFSADISRKAELEDLKARLGLKSLPARIEGFDISNISGKHSVGSMVSFKDGQADKNNYRRFKIKSFFGINDYKMLAEVVRRRYSRLLREKKPLPELVLIDGGKGHVLTAANELKKLALDIPLVSIAKEKENIYEGSGKMLFFPKDSPSMNLIRRVRDEAHRFALGYHHVLRRIQLKGR